MEREALKLALEALEQTLQTLDDENSKPGGAISDTIWHTEHETLFDYLGSEITAIKEALVQPEQEPVAKYCCHVCFDKSGQTFLDRMILCSECGNKRCPKATNHALPCTNSNNPNQAGSVFTTPPQPAQEPWRESASDYERGFIDGRQKQAQSSVDKAVNRMAQRPWVGLMDAEKDGKRVLENGLLFNAAEVQAWELGVEYAEAKLKEKNNG